MRFGKKSMLQFAHEHFIGPLKPRNTIFTFALGNEREER